MIQSHKKNNGESFSRMRVKGGGEEQKVRQGVWCREDAGERECDERVTTWWSHLRVVNTVLNRQQRAPTSNMRRRNFWKISLNVRRDPWEANGTPGKAHFDLGAPLKNASSDSNNAERHQTLTVIKAAGASAGLARVASRRRQTRQHGLGKSKRVQSANYGHFACLPRRFLLR